MRATVARLMPCAAALVAGLVLVHAAPARAQTRPAVRDVCVTVDEARDTLSPQERVAARLLVEKQFEIEGWHVVADGCPAAYTVAHIRLGRRIAVTLSGPDGRREGHALGLDDLPALYSQMVRSVVTGQPMTGMNVVDRTNVTAAQAQPPQRIASESFTYARLGYGTAGPGVGFGHRFEADAIAVDVSFLNLQGRGGSGYYGSANSGTSWSWVKLEGLRFRNRVANSSPYYGGGLGWGGQSSWESGPRWTSWSGSGLQGELTAGYEIGRANTIRAFVQTDVTLPFYRMTSSSGGGPVVGASATTIPGKRYSPSLIVSVGVGWQRMRR